MADITTFPFAFPEVTSTAAINLPTFPFEDFDILSWFAEDMGGNLIKLTFVRNLRALAATTVPSNYSIFGPGGISIVSINFTPGTNIVSFNTTGNMIAGNYTVGIEPLTAQALADPEYNSVAKSVFFSFGSGVADGGSGAGGSKFNFGFQ